MRSEFGKFEIFQSVAGAPEVAVRFEQDDVWLTQKHIALLYGTSKQNVGQHVKSILESGELKEASTVKKFFTIEEKFGRPTKMPILHYNLDMIIALGYRIDSPIAISTVSGACASLSPISTRRYLNFVIQAQEARND